MNARRKRGEETVARLRDWTEAQKAAERLAAQVLSAEGFVSIDPTHPLGGPDELKDLVCERDGFRWVAAVYFPNGDKSPGEVKKKFLEDAQGPPRHGADGLVFVTNQHLTLSEREGLTSAAGKLRVDLYHRERVAGILDRPANYGVRLEYLDIEMDKTEQLAYFSNVSEGMAELRDGVSTLITQVRNKDLDEEALGLTVSRLEDVLTPFGRTGTVSLMMTPLSRIEAVLDRLDRHDHGLSTLLGGSSVITCSGILSPLARIETVLDKLERPDSGIRQLLGGSPGLLFGAGTTLLDRIEGSIAECDHLLDRAEKLKKATSDLED